MSGIKGLDSHSYISVIGCALEYRYIEVMHSSFQILIAVSTSLWDGNCGGDAVAFYFSRHRGWPIFSIPFCVI